MAAEGETGSPALHKAPGASSRAVLKPTTAHNIGGSKSIEDIYQKKTQLEHIVLRPDTYIGSTEVQEQTLWVHDGDGLALRPVHYVPGLYKIFDEILVNAADNKVRDPAMDKLSVDIDVAANSIRILNNGEGVPVEVHKEEKVYVPELIFGHLLTSSNYNDTDEKVTGGRNGYGAKLANIFSTEFTIETCDGRRKRRYVQTFRNNMTVKSEPRISACKATDSWTCVTFKPDLAKFGMSSLDADTVALMRKRVYDMAGVLGKSVKVSFNGDNLPVKTFQDYVGLYLAHPAEARVYAKVGDRWEVCVCVSEGQFQQVSFVNSICTMKGGTHVNYLIDQLTKALCDHINKKDKKANVKPFMVKNYLSIFVNCMIVNPAFDSQTKETLTLKASSFGSECKLPDAFVKKLANSTNLVDTVLSFATFKQSKELKKGDGAKRSRLTGIPKLDDANDAGGRHSEDCTLILTEGDSAKTLAVSGLSVVGRDRFGVFPLRGKLLNVRDASAAQVSGNAEIQNIKQILGLQHGKEYDSTKQLRYGHLMIMTDQDHDGSHIKGLIMNFFHTYYPSLLKLPGFLIEFITPIVKATKGTQVKAFYTLPEYEAWKAERGAGTWEIKYYKGLGTSTEKEAKAYFADIDRHRKEFVWGGDEDAAAIEMAFSKKKIEERKAWLKQFVPGTFLDQSGEFITYSNFINKELILFSRADLDRSIPSMVDGLKPGQRKIMFCCFKRNLKTDVKVAQLVGYISEHSAYHHGEASLGTTIIGLAQRFVGSNNINLLYPAGQFGSRLQGGKDAANPRYIHTKLAGMTRHLFNAADDNLLAYLSEEGQSIEPTWYVPIVPLVLINGAEGIGTGWSTSVPNYNPREIVANLQRLLDGEELVPMKPWYRAFTGTVEEVPGKTLGKSYAINGVIKQADDTSLEVTELPIRRWTQDYKEFLEGLIKPEDKAAQPFIQEYKEHHRGPNVHFSLQLTEAKMAEAQAAGLMAKFKLTSKVSIGNMVLFDRDGIIRRYESPEAIMTDFFELRMEFYNKRRLHLIQTAENQLLRLSNKVRFILAVVHGELHVSNRKKVDIVAALEEAGFDKLASGKTKAGMSEAGEGEEAGPAGPLSYDYLLSMPIYSLTLEKVLALESEAADKAGEVERLRMTSEKQLYHADLAAFLEALEAQDAEDAQEDADLEGQRRQAARRAGAPRKANKAKPAGSEQDDDDDFMPSKVRRAAAMPRAAAKSRTSKPASTATSQPTMEANKTTSPPGVPETDLLSTTADSKADTAAHQGKDTSLADRLAGRMGQLSMRPPVGSTEAADRPASTSSGAAPRVSGSTADQLGPKASTTLRRQAAGKAAIPKRKAKGDGEATALAKLGPDAADASASPAVKPQDKVRRMRPSPFHKGSGASKLAKQPLVELQAGSTCATDTAPAPRASRRAATAAKIAYVELSSDESNGDADEDSDFALSD
ncbi:hypothetical protein WJX72_011500 [[Myrmecia] bisecta]|uniref:DNA topoisomerase 2 n=1 Tax=[Myrmecia] bisecta TaxID=41462 RepID=A0AAW1PZH8_9CHLO